jgi:hypothetical protein
VGVRVAAQKEEVKGKGTSVQVFMANNNISRMPTKSLQRTYLKIHVEFKMIFKNSSKHNRELFEV